MENDEIGTCLLVEGDAFDVRPRKGSASSRSLNVRGVHDSSGLHFQVTAQDEIHLRMHIHM